MVSYLTQILTFSSPIHRIILRSLQPRGDVWSRESWLANRVRPLLLLWIIKQSGHVNRLHHQFSLHISGLQKTFHSPDFTIGIFLLKKVMEGCLMFLENTVETNEKIVIRRLCVLLSPVTGRTQKLATKIFISDLIMVQQYSFRQLTRPAGNWSLVHVKDVTVIYSL